MKFNLEIECIQMQLNFIVKKYIMTPSCNNFFPMESLLLFIIYYLLFMIYYLLFMIVMVIDMIILNLNIDY
jgi:hypothetical protein